MAASGNVCRSRRAVPVSRFRSCECSLFQCSGQCASRRPLMATVQIFNSFKEAIAEKQHDLGADSLKFMLTDVAPTLANTMLSDLTEIAAGNGYTAGGEV